MHNALVILTGSACKWLLTRKLWTVTSSDLQSSSGLCYYPNFYVITTLNRFWFSPKEQTWKLTKYFYAFVLQIGLVSGIALAVILFLGFGAFSSLFTTDLEVLTIAWSGILVRNYRSESLIIGQLFTFWIEAENDHCLCSFEVSCYQTKVFSPFGSSKI